MTVYLDTHVLVWLGQDERHKLNEAARRVIEDCDLLVSPAAVLELELLHEIGRLRADALTVVDMLVKDIGLQVCELPFCRVMECALKEKWGRDAFDWLIVANAQAVEAPLLTKDAKIRRHYSRAIW